MDIVNVRGWTLLLLHLFDGALTVFVCCVGSAEHKDAQENLDLSSDDDDYSDSEAEDIDLEEEEDQDEEEEEEDSNMPPSASKKKKTPLKKPEKESASPFSAGVDKLSVGMKKMSLKKTFSMDFKLPFILVTFNEGEDVMCSIEILVPTYPEDFFLPDTINGGTNTHKSTTGTVLL